MLWRSGHIRAVCSSDEHKLHLRGVRCCMSLDTSSVTSIWLSLPFSIRIWASAPIKTPPLAIYKRLYALFHFWHWFSVWSFLFWLASSTALCITIRHPFTSWSRARSVGDGGLCVWRLIYCLISSVWCCSSIISWGVSAVHSVWACGHSCNEGVWNWVCRSDRTWSGLYGTSLVAAKLLRILFSYNASTWTYW